MTEALKKLAQNDEALAKNNEGEMFEYVAMLRKRALQFHDALQNLVDAEHRFENESGRELDDPVADAVKEAERVLNEEA